MYGWLVFNGEIWDKTKITSEWKQRTKKADVVVVVEDEDPFVKIGVNILELLDL